MKQKRIFIPALALLAVGIAWGALEASRHQFPSPKQSVRQINAPIPVVPAPTPAAKLASQIVFVGPRGNVPVGAPSAYGFWSFAIPVPGVISRSGQPLLSEFQWLKNHGWKSVVDLRIAGDHNEVANDEDIQGFSALGFHYLWLQIKDGSPPTDQQAERFLAFVQNPANQPVEVHCRGGYGRTGVMVALYRYQVDGWPASQAIAESKLYAGGIDSSQAQWLEKWAATHAHSSS